MIDGLAVVKRYDQMCFMLLRLIPPPSSDTLIDTYIHTQQGSRGASGRGRSKGR